MVKLTFVEFSGERREVDAPAGLSVMEAAVHEHVPGIDGDCGGFCACATCHVYVDDDWVDRLPPPEELERHMLDFTYERRANSRLGCQIRLDEGLDGLIVETPRRQY